MTAIAIEPRLCARPDCAKPFTSDNPRRVFCSGTCATMVAHRRKAGADDDGRFPERPCAFCGRPFRPQRPTGRCCSRACTVRNWAARQGPRPQYQPLPVPEVVCTVCGKAFMAIRRSRMYCSSSCAVKARRASMTPEQLQAVADASRVSNIKARMRRYGNTGTVDRSVTLPAVIKRDKGICWLCGKACIERGPQTGHPHYPSMDHVLPLKAGGAHTWKNVRLAHKACNREKWDDVCAGCGGPITTLGDSLCAKCVAKGRGPMERLSVCRQCGAPQVPGAFCDTCSAVGPDLFAGTDLTRVDARALSRQLGFDPDRPARRETPEWVEWMVA